MFGVHNPYIKVASGRSRLRVPSWARHLVLAHRNDQWDNSEDLMTGTRPKARLSFFDKCMVGLYNEALHDCTSVVSNRVITGLIMVLIIDEARDCGKLFS